MKNMLTDSTYFTLRIILYFFILLFAKRISLRFIHLIFSRAVDLAKLSKKRVKTLESLFANVVSYVVYAIVVLMVLKDLGIDTTPIITGAGILGLAVSFGSQTLVKDLISGIFILVENQFNVGDEVEIGEVKGKVKKMTLRMTVLEDENGNLVFIPNSEIKKVKVIKK